MCPTKDGRIVELRDHVLTTFLSFASLSTLIFFKNGKEAARLFGAQKEETLSAELERLLS